MKIRAASRDLTAALAGKNRSDLILFIFSGRNHAFLKLEEQADKLTGRLLSRRRRAEGFTASDKEIRIIDTDLSISGLDRVILCGAGAASKLTADELRKILCRAFNHARDAGAQRLVLPVISADLPGISVKEYAQVVAETAVLVDYEPNHRKTRDWPGESSPSRFKSLTLLCSDSALPRVKEGISFGERTARATNMARDLVNEPSNYLTPARLAGVARQLARQSKGHLTCKVLSRSQIKKLGMGGLLAVNAGSRNAPVLIDLRYDPPAGGSYPVVGLVGKGITFDSGGLGIKDSDNMRDMKDDMGGAAAVLAAMSLLPFIKPAVSVRAVIAATENLVDATSMRPGDIIRTMSGLTVEIAHTDAEGRLTLADALHYVQEVCGATRIVDLATLTGSVEEALGSLVSGVFSNDSRWCKTVLDSAQRAGELMHELPMPQEYREGNKSDMADLSNDGSGPGAIIAAWFLQEFIKRGTQWVHIDIAGTSFRRTAQGVDPVGGTGAGVRTLAQLFANGLS